MAETLLCILASYCFSVLVFCCFILYSLCATLWCNNTHTHTHTRLTAFFPGLPGSACTRKVKPVRILLKQETVSDSGISWAICKYAPRPRQMTTPAPNHSVCTGRMPFLSPNQQRQSTEGTSLSFIRVVDKLSQNVPDRSSPNFQSEISFCDPSRDTNV